MLTFGHAGETGVLESWVMLESGPTRSSLFVGMILILIFAEALGLYGLSVGLMVASTAEGKGKNLCTPYVCCSLPSESWVMLESGPTRSSLLVGMILILIFAETLGLYGLIAIARGFDRNL